jgi:predicted nuclease of predicted toxin-antitoxin system
MSAPLRFLLDSHVSVLTHRALRASGVDVVHALETEPTRGRDEGVLGWAREQDRIVVTRNCRDFVPLLQTLVARGERFPGVLFLASSVRPGAVAAHVAVLIAWIAAAPPGQNPVADRFAWLR